MDRNDKNGRGNYDRGGKGREDRNDRYDRGDRDGRHFDDSMGMGDDGKDGMKKNYRSKYRPEYPADFNFDYKDPVTLGRFTMEGGKIIPSRINKLSNTQQRRLASAVRKSRSLALLPLGTEAYDNFDRPEPISPKPFEI